MLSIVDILRAKSTRSAVEHLITCRTPLSCAGVACGALLALHASIAGAQQSASPKLIGMLSMASAASAQPCQAELRKGLARHGWREGQNYMVQVRYADFDESLLPDRARELAALRPDVMMSSGVAPIVALRGASSTIPIVTFGSGKLMKLGLAKSLARPGTNVTGFSNGEGEHGLKPAEILAQALPAAKRIGVIFNERNPGHDRTMDSHRELARRLGREFVAVWFSGPDSIANAWDTLAERKVDAVVIVSDLGVYIERHVKESRRLRLPAIAAHRFFVQRGGLMSYGYGPRAAVRCEDAARYVDQIFRGRSPSELPIEENTELELTINMKVARELGVRIQPETLARAAALIE